MTLSPTYNWASQFTIQPKAVSLLPRSTDIVVPCWTAYTALSFDGTNFYNVPLPSAVADPEQQVGSNHLPVVTGRGWSAAALNTTDNTFWLLGYANWLIHSLDVASILVAAENETVLQTESGVVIAADSALAAVYPTVTGECYIGLAMIGQVPYFATASGRLFTIVGSTVTEITPNFGSAVYGLCSDGATYLYGALPALGELATATISSGTTATISTVSCPVPGPVLVEHDATYGIAVAGSGPASLGYVCADIAFLAGGTLAAASVPSTNTVHLLTGTNPNFVESGTLSVSNPGVLEWTPNGQQLLVAQSGTVAVINLASGVLTASQTLTVSGIADLSIAPSGDQALIACPSANHIIALTNTLNTWSVGQTLSATGATCVAMITETTAVAGLTNALGNLEQAGTWEIATTVTLPFTPSEVYVDPESNVYACGAASGTGYLIYIAAGTSGGPTKTLSWTGSAAGIFVGQGQVAVLDPTNSEFRWFDDLGWTVKPTQPVTGTATGLAWAGSVVWVCGSSTYPVELYGPHKFYPINAGMVGVYRSGTWATYSLGTNHEPSAMTWGSGGVLYVATRQNDLYTLSAPSAGTLTLTTKQTIPQYSSQATSNPLGIAALANFGGHLYAATSLSGAVVELM